LNVEAQNSRMGTVAHDRKPLARELAPPAELFGDYSPAVTCASALILVLAIATIDKLTGYDLQIGVLHLVPIALVTWAVGRIAGIAFAILAVALWIRMFRGAIDMGASLYFYWNAGVLLLTFLAFIFVIGRLRDALRSSEITYLDKLPAAAYVLDAAGRDILYRNEAFRDTLEGRSIEELARYPAIESEVRWAGRRRARLRILTV
jgi:hypothetical protein